MVGDGPAAYAPSPERAMDPAVPILAEGEDRAQEDLCRVMVEGAPVPMWAAGADGGWLYCNPAWCDFTGRPVEEHLGSGWMRGLHPQDADGFLALYQRAV